AFADTMDRQLDGHPAAGMAGALLDEVDRLQELTEDLSDSRRMLDGSVIVQRQAIQLGELAQQFLYRHAGRVADVRAGAQWDTEVICDHRKTVRAMSRIADSMQLAVPGAELELLVDESAPRIGIAVRSGDARAETLQELLEGAPIAAGDAGFQRSVALGLLKCQQIAVEADDQVIWFDLPGTTDSLTERWSSWLATESLAPVTLFDVRLFRRDRSHAGESDADCEFDLQASVELQVANEIAIDAASEEQTWADTYLHQSLTARDLVFARGGNRWLVALAGGAHEAESRMHRLTATAVVVDSNHRLESELVATYHLPLEAERLQGRLGKLLGTSRRILLVDADPKPVSPVSRRLLEAGYDVVSLDESSQLQDAAAIVGDAESIETVEALRGRMPNIPVFLVGSLKDQQRILQQNVRFVNDNDDRYQDLLEALQQSSPAPLGWHHATHEDDRELATSPFFLDGFEFAPDGEPDASPF
ncbi:MAG: hypothetical protein KDA47_22710, partial [Planctomycetales bacterium]|nr:hypothetical protein [Planctomycetales bacterium]